MGSQNERDRQDNSYNTRAAPIGRRQALQGGAAMLALALGGAQTVPARLSPSALTGLKTAMEDHVARGFVPGAVWAIHWQGETHVDSAGTFAFDGGQPMARDTIFRIASLTKPVTAAAAMKLVEQGVLTLDGPVDPFLPELADRSVLKSLDADLDDTVPAERSITLRDLLSLRFGLGAIMVFPEKYPIQKAMREAELAPGADLFAEPDDVFMDRLARLPLAFQPGRQFLYHTGLDVAGVLIARASGKPLSAVLSELIFRPLGMTDTGFHVPENKIGRLPICYRRDRQTGEVVVHDEARNGRFAEPPPFEAGGGGLVSTVDDYLAFCRMMLNGGELDGTRILRPDSVAEMTRDQLTPAQKDGPHAMPFMNGHSGWGLGMSVALERAEPWLVPGRFGWDGGYGTSAYTDPENGAIGVFMSQRMMDSPQPPQTFTDFWRHAYRAIEA